MEANGIHFTDFKSYINENSGTLESSEDAEVN